MFGFKETYKKNETEKTFIQSYFKRLFEELEQGKNK